MCNQRQSLIAKLEELREQIHLMDEATTEYAREEIAGDILTLDEELEDLFENKEMLVDTYLTEVSAVGNQVLYDLNNLEPVEVWEENLQTVLTMLVERFLANTEEWTNTEYEDLETIADQCRYEGGIGVGLARAAIGKLDYDDEADCPGYSERMVSDTRAYHSENRIQPNPANLKCEIQLGNITTGYLDLSDMQGKSQQQIEFYDKNKLEIDTQKLVAGLYFVRIYSDNGRIWIGKFTVAH